MPLNNAADQTSFKGDFCKISDAKGNVVFKEFDVDDGGGRHDSVISREQSPFRPTAALS